MKSPDNFDVNKYSDNLIISGYNNYFFGANMARVSSFYLRGEQIEEEDLFEIKKYIGPNNSPVEFIKRYIIRLDQVIRSFAYTKQKFLYRALSVKNSLNIKIDELLIFKPFTSLTESIDIARQYVLSSNKNMKHYFFEFNLPAGFTTYKIPLHYRGSNHENYIRQDVKEFILPLCSVTKVISVVEIQNMFFIKLILVEQPDILKTFKIEKFVATPENDFKSYFEKKITFVQDQNQNVLTSPEFARIINLAYLYIEQTNLENSFLLKNGFVYKNIKDFTLSSIKSFSFNKFLIEVLHHSTKNYKKIFQLKEFLKEVTATISGIDKFINKYITIILDEEFNIFLFDYDVKESDKKSFKSFKDFISLIEENFEKTEKASNFHVFIAGKMERNLIVSNDSIFKQIIEVPDILSFTMNIDNLKCKSLFSHEAIICNLYSGECSQKDYNTIFKVRVNTTKYIIFNSENQKYIYFINRDKISVNVGSINYEKTNCYGLDKITTVDLFINDKKK